MPTISICIIAFNASQYVSRCLNSISTQTIPPYEIIFVDDNSSDGTYEIAKSYESILSTLKVYKLRINSRVGKSRNIAISKSSGDYVWAVDCDDTLPCNAIEIFTNYIKKYNSEIIVGAENILSNDGNLKSIFSVKKQYYNIVPIDYPELSIFTTGFHHAMCIKKDFLMKYNIKYGENLVASADGVFLFSLLPYTSKCTIIKEIIYNYYENDHSVSRVRSTSFYRDDFYAWAILISQYKNSRDLEYTANRSLYRIKEFINTDTSYINNLSTQERDSIVEYFLDTFNKKELCSCMLYQYIKRNRPISLLDVFYLLALRFSSKKLINLLISITIIKKTIKKYIQAKTKQ